MSSCSELITQLLAQPVGWLADSAPNEDIAISTRIRLARNLANTPFPGHATDEQRLETAQKIADGLTSVTTTGKERWRFDVAELDDVEKMILFERRLASRELFRHATGAGLYMNPDECTAIMVNEEDHFRLQGLLPGLQLANLYKVINRVDDAIAEKFDLAFDSKLGYLTSCPTNLGTGMRASVMLHLPGLVLSGQITGVIQGINKLNFAVRGIYGEGSDNRGNLFQVSNQSTLGESENEILNRLNAVITKLIELEKIARKTLLATRSNFVLDQVGRAYGILRHGYILSNEEALNFLSMLRLGVDLQMFNALNIHTVNDLFIRVNPAHLQKLSQHEHCINELDSVRAELVRNSLHN